MPPQQSLIELPSEVLELIISFLDNKTLATFNLLSRKCHNFIDEHFPTPLQLAVMQKWYERDFITPVTQQLTSFKQQTSVTPTNFFFQAQPKTRVKALLLIPIAILSASVLRISYNHYQNELNKAYSITLHSKRVSAIMNAQEQIIIIWFTLGALVVVGGLNYYYRFVVPEHTLRQQAVAEQSAYSVLKKIYEGYREFFDKLPESTLKKLFETIAKSGEQSNNFTITYQEVHKKTDDELLHLKNHLDSIGNYRQQIIRNQVRVSRFRVDQPRIISLFRLWKDSKEAKQFDNNGGLNMESNSEYPLQPPGSLSVKL